ncbi:MAG: DUF4129 domain-containing protein [Halolamina sp.]
MKRDTALALVLALLALLAIGIAAATLDNPVSSSGDGFGSGSGGGIGSGAGEQTETERNSSPSLGIPGLEEGKLEAPAPCYDHLDTLPVKLAIVLAILAIGAIAAYLSEVPVLGVAIIGPLSVFTYTIFLILTTCGTLELNFGGGIGLGAGQQGANNSTAGGSMGDAADAVASQPSILLGIVLVVLVGAAVLLLFVATGDAGEEPEETEEMPSEPEMPDIGAIGRAAGDAADRIVGEADAENEVYRAWAEMTDYLAVEGPESSTPAEFAEAAIDAGMAPDDVRELTDLFEAVRYGTEEATADREARAVAALRRVEDGYAEGEE